jgi:hypothetical protein
MRAISGAHDLAVTAAQGRNFPRPTGNKPRQSIAWTSQRQHQSGSAAELQLAFTKREHHQPSGCVEFLPEIIVAKAIDPSISATMVIPPSDLGIR